eukprot:TRINITY_DN1078_c0_g1_i3.p1 TRINITY_DN1078_c0_g1~~TRINITY_DN1078_c0_g1_i3.p1  ORF type:complete len:300 (-),score=58.78 TRINITY_DN1078_c0_g1_i3:218-1030(-)
MNDIAMIMLKNKFLQIIRLTSTAVIITATVNILIESIKGQWINEEVNAFSLLSTVFLSVYMLMQIIVFLVLNEKIHLERCLGKKPEAFQSICIVYIIIGVTFYLIFGCLIKVAFSGHFSMTLIGVLSVIPLIILDGIAIYLTYPVICLSLMLLLVLTTVLYTILYLIYYTVYRRCHSSSAEELALKVKLNISEVLDKVAYKYSVKSHMQQRREILCSVCLESLEGRLVVCLDCNPSHVFHKKCIKTWIFKDNVCPLCKLPIMPEEVYDVI